MSASRRALELIHELTAEHLVDVLEKVKKGDMELDAKILTQINSFLKNNDIKCEVEETPGVEKLREEVQEMSAAPFDPKEVDERFTKGIAIVK